ncbi:Type I Iterative PKS [Pestalotiopsis sp. IQ-011]
MPTKVDDQKHAWVCTGSDIRQDFCQSIEGALSVVLRQRHVGLSLCWSQMGDMQAGKGQDGMEKVVLLKSHDGQSLLPPRQGHQTMIACPVFLVTGSTNGIGRELAQILYSAHAKVWLVARSKAKAEQAIKDIQAAAPSSKGRLEYLIADFNDLTTIKPAAEDFLQREAKLDGYEAQLGVNALASFLLTHLLTDILLRTARDSSANDTRVVWVSSSAAGAFPPKGGVDMDAINVGNKFSQWQNYGVSKAGNILHSAIFARKYGSHGVLSVNMPKWQHVIARRLALKPSIYGAYTELFAGLSKDVVVQDGAAWVSP